jgi:hypothetical protein
MKVRYTLTAAGHIDVDMGSLDSGYKSGSQSRSLWALEVASQKVPMFWGDLAPSIRFSREDILGSLSESLTISVQKIELIDDGTPIVHNGVPMTLSQFRFLVSTFAPMGGCHCDDSECPFCTKDKTKIWVDELNSLNSSLR